MGSILGLKRAIDKVIKKCTYCCYVRCETLRVCVLCMRVPWPQTGVNHNNAQLGNQDKGRAMKDLVV